MGQKIEESKKIYLYRVACILIVVIAALPVSCNYIMNGGLVMEWIVRVEEMAEGFRGGQFFLFPSSDTLINVGIQANAMNSNLWYVLPAFFYWLSGNVVLAYRIYMLGLQIGTFFASYLLFKRVFIKEGTKVPIIFGVLLYMSCPYRIYVCYDLANLSQAAAWMCLPLYLWAAIRIMDGEKSPKDLLAAALALAGMGYADAILFVTALGITLLIGVISRKIMLFASAAGAVIFFGPGLLRLMRYLFLDYYGELDMSLQPIMPSGYRIGQFFSSYAFRDGHPGVGLGMFVCMLVMLWLSFVEGKREKNKKYKIFLVSAFLFSMLSTRYFPWDDICRIGIWALKLVSLIGTPAVFFGVSFLCLCVPAAWKMKQISMHENRIVSLIVPMTVFLFCIGICIYQCNMLTYNREPLGLP